MLRSRCALMAFAALVSTSSSAAAAPFGKSLCVVLVKSGPVTPLRLGEAHLALRQGITAPGATVLDDAVTAELAALADPVSGECDEACEKRMRAALADRGQLVLARLRATATHFVLRVSAGEGEASAAGPLTLLKAGAMQIGNRVASSGEGTLILEGPRNAEWFVNGTEVDAAKPIRIAPGRHVVRIGDGMGAERMAMAEIAAGEATTVRLGRDSKAKSAVAVPTPVGPGTGGILTPLPARPWAVRGGLSVMTRTHALSGADGGGFYVVFTGTGPRVSAEFRHDAIVAVLEGAWMSFALSKAHFDAGGGNSYAVTGGSTASLRASGGYRLGGDDAASVTPAVSMRHEMHAADDVENASGGSLGLLPSYSRTAVDLVVRGELPLGSRLRLDGALGVSPFTIWNESPARTTGRSPRCDLSPAWNLGASLPAGAWTVRADYAGEIRSVQFHGAGPTSTAPDIRNGKIEQTFHSATLTAGRHF